MSVMTSISSINIISARSAFMIYHYSVTVIYSLHFPIHPFSYWLQWCLNKFSIQCSSVCNQTEWN